MSSQPQTRPPWDPDPRFVVGPEPVHETRRRPDPETGCGLMLLALVGAAIALGIVIAVVLLLVTAPSSASNPRSHTGSALSGAPSSGELGRPSEATPHILAGGRFERPAPLGASTPASPPVVEASQDLTADIPRIIPTELAPPVKVVQGWATWFAACSRCAAAGPAVREMFDGDWRGRWVTVEAKGRRITVKLTDWCACGDRHGDPTVIDLSRQAFARLAPPSRGVVHVEVSPVDVVLPPTDTE